MSRKRGLKIGDEGSQAAFIEELSRSFGSGKSNPILIHGRRVEGMFEYVAASMGKCVLIKREDAGDVCSAIQGVLPPDFRFVLESGEEIFVEVKNCHKKDPNHPFRLKDTYLESLEAYCRIFKRELWIAVFWSQWKRWTLVSPRDLRRNGASLSISMLEAMRQNQMAMLGDLMIGTTPPLVFRVIADSSKPRSVDDSGEVAFTIGKIELYCNGRAIENQLEQRLAFYFMLHSDWGGENPRAEVINGDLVYFDYVAQPSEQTPGQGFEILGCLSDMISRHYNDLTAS